MGAFAEFERALTGERQRESIVWAKKRGAYRRRKTALSPQRATELRKRAAAGEQKSGLARVFCMRQTLHQYLRTEEVRQSGLVRETTSTSGATILIPCTEKELPHPLHVWHPSEDSRLSTER